MRTGLLSTGGGAELLTGGSKVPNTPPLLRQMASTSHFVGKHIGMDQREHKYKHPGD